MKSPVEPCQSIITYNCKFLWNISRCCHVSLPLSYQNLENVKQIYLPVKQTNITWLFKAFQDIFWPLQSWSECVWRRPYITTQPTLTSPCPLVPNELYRIGLAWLVLLTGTHISICSTWAGRGDRLGGSAAFSVTSESFTATASSNGKSA